MVQHPPANIDGVSGPEEMTRMWQKHLCDLYDCAGRPSFGQGETDNKEDVTVSSEEIYDANRTLKTKSHVGWIRYLLNICS